MKKNWFKYGVVVVSVTGVLTSVSIVVTEMYLEPSAGADVAPSPTAEAVGTGGADFLKGVPLLLVAPEGRLDLFGGPGGQVIGSLDHGTLVRIVEVRMVGETQWFLVEVEGGKGRGWLPTEGLTIEMAPAISFDHFVFCTGDAAGPGFLCGRELPLATEALWLRWSFQGLREGDELQRVLVMESERFQSPPQRWDGPASGEQLVNLMADHELPKKPGVWVVEFFVNGKVVGETSVWLR